eukprot:6753247-Prymnesium_polylepis.2
MRPDRPPRQARRPNWGEIFLPLASTGQCARSLELALRPERRPSGHSRKADRSWRPVAGHRSAPGPSYPSPRASGCGSGSS